jgi:hypothetical protein
MYSFQAFTHFPEQPNKLETTQFPAKKRENKGDFRKLF